MRSASCWVVAAIAAMAGAGAARAETGEDSSAPAAQQSAPAAAMPAPGSARPAPRPAMFAPAAAANTKPLTAQQREEWRFLKEAAASSRFEADASRLALTHSEDPRVRSLATMLINHHASSGNELLHLLHGRGMAPPMMRNDQRKTLNRLARLQGRKFDREFVEQVGLRYQQEDVRVYEKAGLAATDPALKAWIERKLPTLRYNLMAATRIAPSDMKLARTRPGMTANEPKFIRQSATSDGAAPPSRFVSRASLSTQSMGAGASHLGSAPAAPAQRIQRVE